MSGNQESAEIRSLMEYVGAHKELDEDYQQQLIDMLDKNQLDEFWAAVEELKMNGLMDDDDIDDNLSEAEQRELDATVEALLLLDRDKLQEPHINMQYINNAAIAARLSNQQKAIALHGSARKDQHISEEFGGELWEISFFVKTSLEYIETTLTPFDFAVLDVIYSLYFNEITIFNTAWIDHLLTGNPKRLSSPTTISRIDLSIDKLNRIYYQINIDSESRSKSRLLYTLRFGAKVGYTYVLKRLTDIYKYAHESQQVINYPSEWLNTSDLPKAFAFSDSETAILIKRKVIARVGRILHLSNRRGKQLKNWNRLSLIQEKDNTKGLFPALGLMPAAQGEEDDWRKNKKPRYIKAVVGTLENLKRKYAILDYEEHREGGSTSRKAPITGYDIICFNKTEAKALKSMRDEQKPAYVQDLLAKRKAHQS